MPWNVQGVSVPATQTVPNYALLAVVYGVLQLSGREKRQNGFGGYAVVAFLDVEANFLVVSSRLNPQGHLPCNGYLCIIASACMTLHFTTACLDVGHYA